MVVILGIGGEFLSGLVTDTGMVLHDIGNDIQKDTLFGESVTMSALKQLDQVNIEPHVCLGETGNNTKLVIVTVVLIRINMNLVSGGNGVLGIFHFVVSVS